MKEVTAEVLVDVSGEGAWDEAAAKVGVEISKLGDGTPLRVAELERSSTHDQDNTKSYRASFTMEKPDLWWPHGYGEQALYQVTVRVHSAAGMVVAQQTKNIGFRRVELMLQNDSLGQSFYFRINGVDIFAGGSCWIPADSLLSRITDQTYRNWVQLARDGNQIMLRVWGGGIYESEAFYDACDELGILVWQDFAFACANYPAYEDFLSSAEVEARCNIRRLQHHPSLIIWAGNNEDYQIVERYGLQYDFAGDKNPQSWLRSDFPARYIYEYFLPKILEEEAPGSVYRPSSPWGNGKSTTLKVDPSVGDIHQWNVWHGDMRLIQDLPDMGGRFVSEFGMEAYPHVETLESVISDPAQRYPGSRTLDFHNKAVGHERRLVTYVAENFRLVPTLRGFAHLTQVLQADALSTAYKSWRRQWGLQTASAGSESVVRGCGGVLVWQFNDCWPTVSWAVVDYFRVKKPAYYAIRRALQPVAIGVSRRLHDWTARRADKLWQRDTGHIDPTRALSDVVFDLWVSSSETQAVRADVTVRFVSIASGKDVMDRWYREIVVQPNGTTNVYTDCSAVPINLGLEGSLQEAFVIHAVLRVDGQEISRDTSWPDPIKYLDLTDRGVNMQFDALDSSITVSAARPVKGLVFTEKRGMTISDNGFDIIPGEDRLIHVEGVLPAEVTWTFVQQND
jgi:beta-mannosidase